MAIQSKGFIITSPGEEAVGIFEQDWNLTGEFEFDDQGDLAEFKRKISEAFELCSDTPICVESFEERSTRINEELAAFPGAFHCSV